MFQDWSKSTNILSRARTHVETKPLHDHHQSKKGGKDQESIQSSTTPNTGYHIGKKTPIHHKQEPRGQPFPSR